MALRLQETGVAKIFTSTFTAAEFTSALTTMLHPQNSTPYVLRARYLSRVLRQAGGKRHAADFVENILELGGFDHLVPYSYKHMTYIQREGLDVGAAYVVLALFGVQVTLIVIKKVERWLWRKKQSVDTKAVDAKKTQ